MKLKDRVAIVTGAGSGIGQATALLFAQEGARVGVVDLDADAARGTTQQIEKGGGQALAVTADVSRAFVVLGSRLFDSLIPPRTAK